MGTGTVRFAPPPKQYQHLARLHKSLHHLATRPSTALEANHVRVSWRAVLADGKAPKMVQDGSFHAAKQVPGLFELMDLFYDAKKVTLSNSLEGHQLLEKAVDEAKAFVAVLDLSAIGK